MLFTVEIVECTSRLTFATERPVITFVLVVERLGTVLYASEPQTSMRYTRTPSECSE